MLSVHLDICLGWLDHMIILHLTSDQPPKCLTAPTSFYILTTSAEGYQFVYMLTNTCYFSFICLSIYFGNSHLTICEVVSHCGFYLSFPWASQVMLVVKNPLANAGDTRNMSSIPGSGRS